MQRTTDSPDTAAPSTEAVRPVLERALAEALGEPAFSGGAIPAPAPEMLDLIRAAVGEHAEGMRLAPLPASVTALSQIHRATRPGGDDLLVEVLRPDDIDRFAAACADESVVAAAADGAGLAVERANELIIERRKHLLDLRSGARDQSLVADLLRGHPHVAIAQPEEPFVREGVRAVQDPGGHLLGEARTRDPEQRAEWAESLHRLAFGMLRRHGLALTGLDPALVRFLPDGGIALLRLGVVEHVDPAALDAFDRLVWAAMERDEVARRQAIDSLGGGVPDQWHRPISDPTMPATPVDRAGDGLITEAGPIDRLHRTVGAILDGLGGAAPVHQVMSELWRGAEPITDLGKADREWWQSRTPLVLIDDAPEDGNGAGSAV